METKHLKVKYENKEKISLAFFSAGNLFLIGDPCLKLLTMNKKKTKKRKERKKEQGTNN